MYRENVCDLSKSNNGPKNKIILVAVLTTHISIFDNECVCVYIYSARLNEGNIF